MHKYDIPKWIASRLLKSLSSIWSTELAIEVNSILKNMVDNHTKAINTLNKQTFAAMPPPPMWMATHWKIKQRIQAGIYSVGVPFAQIISRVCMRLMFDSGILLIWVGSSHTENKTNYKLQRLRIWWRKKFGIHRRTRAYPHSTSASHPHLSYKMLKFQFVFCRLESRLSRWWNAHWFATCVWRKNDKWPNHSRCPISQ